MPKATEFVFAIVERPDHFSNVVFFYFNHKRGIGMGLTPYKPESDRPLSMKTGYLGCLFFKLQRCHAELTQVIESMRENEPWFDKDENTSKKPAKAGN